MIHTQIYRMYRECLPVYMSNTKAYFPNGKNSIRVRQNNGQEFIFTFINTKSWKFETIDCFIDTLKGKKHG